jgi:hypothetical protein
MPYYSQDMIGGAMNSTHIYYNVNVSNDYSGWDISSNGQPMQVATNNKNYQLVFNQTRQQPYLINPSEYYLSILRFTIATPNLPVFVCQPITGQADVNKTVYAITLVKSDGLIATRNLVWQPDDLSVPPPNGIVDNSWQINPYYYCHSFNHMMNLINNTFDWFLYNGGGGPDGGGAFLTQSDAPYIYLDSSSNLCTVGGNANVFRTDLDGGFLNDTTKVGVKIFFNIELYNLLSSLKSMYYGSLGPAIGADYQLIMDSGSNTLYADTQPFITNVVYNSNTEKNDVINRQEYNTLPLWSPIAKIIFRTTLLNVVPDIVGTPVVYENGNNNINNGKQNTDILNIMIDYSVPLTKGTEMRPYIYYEPLGEYRLTELYGNQPINSMDIAVFWKDSFGNLHPFYLDIAASATIKILFRKKIFDSDKV